MSASVLLDEPEMRPLSCPKLLPCDQLQLFHCRGLSQATELLGNYHKEEKAILAGLPFVQIQAST